MILYKLINRKKPGEKTDPGKIYATPVKRGSKPLKSIGSDIVKISSLSKGDVDNVLSNLVDLIPDYLLEGNSVHLGELGTMRLSFSSEGVENEEDFSTSKIKGLKIIFTPGKDLKDKISRARFEKA